MRQHKAQPILTEIKKQLDALNEQTPPQGALGKAVGYALGQWDRLIRYLDNGILHPDNNLALSLGLRYPEHLGNPLENRVRCSRAA